MHRLVEVNHRILFIGVIHGFHWISIVGMIMVGMISSSSSEDWNNYRMNLMFDRLFFISYLLMKGLLISSSVDVTLENN